MWGSSINGCLDCFRLSFCLTTSNYTEVDIPDLASLAKEEGLLDYRRSKWIVSKAKKSQVVCQVTDPAGLGMRLQVAVFFSLPI